MEQYLSYRDEYPFFAEDINLFKKMMMDPTYKPPEVC